MYVAFYCMFGKQKETQKTATNGVLTYVGSVVRHFSEGMFVGVTAVVQPPTITK